MPLVWDLPAVILLAPLPPSPLLTLPLLRVQPWEVGAKGMPTLPLLTSLVPWRLSRSLYVHFMLPHHCSTRLNSFRAAAWVSVCIYKVNLEVFLIVRVCWMAVQLHNRICKWPQWLRVWEAREQLHCDCDTRLTTLGANDTIFFRYFINQFVTFNNVLCNYSGNTWHVSLLIYGKLLTKAVLHSNSNRLEFEACRICLPVF